MKKEKIALRTVICATILSISLGFVLQFIYEWTDKNGFVALFGAVNESIWEHLKLLFMPFLFTMLIEFFIYGRKSNRFFSSKLIGIIAGLVSTVMLYYTYTGIWGVNSEVVNIIIYVACVIISYTVAYLVMTRTKFKSGLLESLCIFFFAAILTLFFLFTFDPPHIPLFRDAITMKYGIGE